jgi:hypothetical protein
MIFFTNNQAALLTISEGAAAFLRSDILSNIKKSNLQNIELVGTDLFAEVILEK